MGLSEKLVDEYGYSGIYIVFDEFSKFIEGQNNTAAGTNMHLLQSMCELATDSKNAQVFITMVTHKSIKEYGKYLSRDLINLFTGIEGRIIEKYFVTSSKNNYELIKNAIVKDDSKLLNIPHYEKYLGKEKFKEFFSLPAFRSGFDETEFKNVIFNGCYPLNPIAAYLLLNISEKVAQNERTLFTFISNDEPHSMARFVSEHTSDKEWSIGADLIYEYFSALFKKDVVNEFIHNIWLSAEYAIDKCDTEDQRKIVKALAVILIVNKEDEIPATEKYLKLCINASDPEQALIELKKKEFIYKKNSTGSYVFKTRAGSELKAEIKRQRELKGDNVNYSKVLLDVTGNYFIIPRKYNTVKMMTRYFTNEFMDVDDFLNITSSTVLLDNTLDGKVITLYSFSRIKQEAVKQHLLELAEKRLVVICPKKGLKAKKQLKDYEIISDLKENQLFTDNNEILKRELPLLLDDLTIELETIIGSVYEDDLDTKVFYFNDDRIENVKSGNVEEAVNECCLNVYTSTPIINNEMVNRAEIGTAQTKKARLNIVQTILSHTDTPEFYNGSNQEATIYRALFGVTGIIDGDTREDIQFVIDEINRYVDSCCDKKVAVKEIVYKLVKAPYGMRTGVIPFYLAYVLANRREDIIVYFLNKEVQITSEIVVNMCEQPEDYAIYVSKEDLQKEKYISELNMLFEVEDNRNLSSNRIKDIIICMQRWFRSLQQATRNVICLDQYVDNDNMVQAMKTIKKAMQKVEFNPFEILFVEFPEAFGTDSLEETFKVIDDCKTCYDDYFRWIEEQAITAIYGLWDRKRKQDLYHTLKEWYDKQSKRSKMGLYDGRMTNFMSCLEGLDVYSDQDVASKVVKWFDDESIRTLDDDFLKKVKNGVSPFKAEVATYIKKNSVIVDKYKKEIEMLSKLSEKNIAGVITTNYDDFVESNFIGYTKFVGQKQLIFSSIQGVAEIFKIHGSIEEPDSLVINEQDYLEFDKKSAYLAAKLMTIFMEYPIIFMGYSISDTNIQKIIKSIIECLATKQIEILADRFIFVEYQPEKVGIEVSPYTIMVGDKPLLMKRVVVEDFKLIYKALEGKKSKLPVRILRRFKQELYDFTVTNMPSICRTRREDFEVVN